MAGVITNTKEQMMHSPKLACLGLSAQLLVAPLMLCQQAAGQSVPPDPPRAAEPTALSIDLDVVSIRPNKDGTGGAQINSPRDGDYIAISNMSPHMMVGLAFNFPLHDEIYGLPGWADREAYDLTAKVSEKDLAAFQRLLPMERNPLLQKVLESRFHLKYHYETKVLRAYALVVGKKGARLVESGGIAQTTNAAASRGAMHTRYGEIIGEAVPMEDFAHVLSQQIGRPVADKTGLKGGYNFKLNWTPEMDPSSTTAPTDDTGPSLFTALQEQLGLKLEPAKVPVRVLVVDQIDRPDQN